MGTLPIDGVANEDEQLGDLALEVDLDNGVRFEVDLPQVALMLVVDDHLVHTVALAWDEGKVVDDQLRALLKFVLLHYCGQVADVVHGQGFGVYVGQVESLGRTVEHINDTQVLVTVVDNLDDLAVCV